MVVLDVHNPLLHPDVRPIEDQSSMADSSPMARRNVETTNTVAAPEWTAIWHPVPVNQK